VSLPPLAAWTYDVILTIVRTYEYEPGEFDYKSVLNAVRDAGRDQHNASIARTAASMANSGGGFILFGVTDRAQQVNPSEARIQGIPLDGDLRKEFWEKIKGIQPELHFEAAPAPIALPSDSTRGVFVVSVPQSPRRPHMVWPAGVFFRRGAGGAADAMNVYEVRDQ
jgi:predicted HTH transcriptional regulator